MTNKEPGIPADPNAVFPEDWINTSRAGVRISTFRYYPDSVQDGAADLLFEEHEEVYPDNLVEAAQQLRDSGVNFRNGSDSTHSLTQDYKTGEQQETSGRLIGFSADQENIIRTLVDEDLLWKHAQNLDDRSEDGLQILVNAHAQPSADRLEELDELSALDSMGEYELSELEIAEMDILRALYLKKIAEMGTLRSLHLENQI